MQDGDAKGTLLAEAEEAVRVLATEKVQLLEAYELLEEDTGRLIDDAVQKQRKRVSELEKDLKARAHFLAFATGNSYNSYLACLYGLLLSFITNIYILFCHQRRRMLATFQKSTRSRTAYLFQHFLHPLLFTHCQ